MRHIRGSNNAALADPPIRSIYDLDQFACSFSQPTATRQMGTRWAQRRSPSGKVQPKWLLLRRHTGRARERSSGHFPVRLLFVATELYLIRLEVQRPLDVDAGIFALVTQNLGVGHPSQ